VFVGKRAQTNRGRHDIAYYGVSINQASVENENSTFFLTVDDSSQLVRLNSTAVNEQRPWYCGRVHTSHQFVLDTHLIARVGIEVSHIVPTTRETDW
jgi:hypothetical protein